jgi:hypothetical protein
MPDINLKSIVSSGKSTIAQIGGAINNAAGKGGFSVSAGPNGVSISANFNELLKKKVSGNKIQSPIKELYENDTTKPTLYYPADLDNEHFMIFSVKKRKRDFKEELGTINTYQNIVLPIPSNLTLQQSANYSDKELGLMGGMAAGRINSADITKAGSALSDVIGKKISAATDAFKNEDTDAMIKGAGVAAPAAVATGATGLLGGLGGLLALGATAGDAAAGVSVDSGVAINPHLAVVFQGVGFRSHSFTYKFIARNQDESDTIKNIINTFKYFMLPSFAGGSKLAFNYPDEFEIEFAEAVSPYLYDIGTCVLKDVSVNYNGEGTPLFFENSGAPVSIELQLAFQETQIFTKERLDNRMESNV